MRSGAHAGAHPNLETLLNDSALKAQLVERGTRRLTDFPLQKSIDQTLDVYRAVANPVDYKQLVV